MAKYLSFGEVASRLGCDNQKVRQLVIEDKSLRATRITPNGLVLSECGLNGHFTYDLDFNSHLSIDGEITCDTYRLNAIGETEKTQTLFVGYLRVESAELQRFLSEKTPFTNDDNTLDDAALAGLVERATDAASAPAPVVVASDASATPAATVARGRTLKKSALIDKYERRWPTIKRDFQDASENELSRAAKAPGHGNWFEEDALNWARQRGKLSEETGQHAPSPATPFSGMTHRIMG